MNNPTKTRQPREIENDRQTAAVRALTEASHAMVSDLQLSHLLQRIMEITVKVLDSAAGSLFLWDPGAQRLSVRIACPESHNGLQNISILPDRGIAGWVFSMRTPVNVADPAADPRYCPDADRALGSDSRSLLAAPLLTQQDCLGVIEVFDKRWGKPFDQLDLDILTSLAGQAAFAIDNSLLSTGLNKQRDRLLTIEREIHKKLARDLHDGPAQWLASVSMNLEYVVRLLDSNPAEARVELAAVRTTLDKTIQQVRHLMFELRPVVLETDGLAAAIRHYVDSLKNTGGMNVRLDLDLPGLNLNTDEQRCVFDIVREALSNVRRHAHTQEAWVSMRVVDGRLIVTVRDNGLGFDLASVQRDYSQRGSLGLLNMMERAASVGATIVIDSVPGYGTSVRLTLPFRPLRSDQSEP